MTRIILILLLVCPLISKAQLESPYSQHFFNQAVFNPAYTGINGVTSLNFVSRLQWVGIDGAPVTNILNLHTSFLTDKIGAGVILVNDSYGINSNNEIHLTYSYKIEFRNTILSFGLQTGYVRLSYDYGKLNNPFIDPSFIESGESFSAPNFGAGIFVMNPNYYFGFSVPKFMDIDVESGGITSTRYKRHFFVSGGYIFDKVFAFKLKPSFLYRTVDGGFSALDLSISALINERIWVGGSLRNIGEAFTLHSILEINKNLRAGISFEMSSKTFSGANFGTYEVMITYDLGSVGNRYF